jgi:hypothetical protein
LAEPATEFGTAQREIVAQGVEQRQVGVVDGDIMVKA